MLVLFKKINKSKFYLGFFIILCLITLIPIKDEFFLVLFRFLKHLFLFLYYLKLSKKHSSKIILINILFAISSVFIVLKIELFNYVVAVLVILARFLLILYSFNKLNFKLLNYKIAAFVLGLSLCITVLLLSFYYNSDAFYIIALVTLLLTINFAISFLNILNSPNRANLLFFTAISMFIISDTFFGAILLNDKALYSIFTMIIYNLAYFLLNQSAIQSERKFE